MLNLHPFIPILRAFRQNTPSFLGGNESHRRNCMHSLWASRWLHRQHVAADDSLSSLFRRIFSGRAPVGTRSFALFLARKISARICRTLGAPRTTSARR